jgi:hypothetical protein
MVYFDKEKGKWVWLRFFERMPETTHSAPYLFSKKTLTAHCLLLISYPTYPIDKEDDKEAEERANYLYEQTKPYKAELLNFKTGKRKFWNGKTEITSNISQLEKVNIDILVESLRLLAQDKQKIYHVCVLKLLNQGDLGTGYEDLTPDHYKELMPIEVFGNIGRSQLYDKMPKNEKIDDWDFDYKKNNATKTRKFKEFAHRLVNLYYELIKENGSLAKPCVEKLV